MKVSGIRQLRKEDYPDAPGWFFKALYLLNNFFQSINQALSGNLTFQDNIQSRILTIEVDGSAPSYTFTLDDSLPQVTGIIPLKCTPTPTSAPYVVWEQVGNEVVISDILGIPSSGTVTVQVLVI